MYVSSFLSLQTALSGVEAAQEELSTTGNNIANENTTDYEEESVSLSPSLALSIAAGGNSLQLGTGVNATGVVNQSNQYIDTAYRAQNAASSAATTTQSYATQLESLLGENNNNSGAISSQLSQFWTDWSSLADNPGNAGAQEAVVDDGEGLASSINSVSSEIGALRDQATSQYENITADSSGGQVYDDVTRLATLNGAIQQATEGGYSANQLVDQRSAVIDDLSSLASVQVTNNSDGTVNLSFGGVTNLVAGTTVNWPSTSATGSTLGSSGFTFPGSAASVGGTLGALLGFAGSGGTLDQVAGQLDGVAGQLASSVNTLTAGSSSGISQFFTITTGGTPGSAAASLAVNSALVSDPAETPTSSTATAGSNDIALAVSQLSGGAPDQSYEALVESVGGITQQATNNATSQSALATQITTQRQSAEGVDNNQEMSNLIQEQQAYEASAKVMSAFSTMMDSLMSVVGQ